MLFKNAKQQIQHKNRFQTHTRLPAIQNIMNRI